MAYTRKKKPLPISGAVFAFPIDEGRFGACRVIRYATDDDEVWQFGKNGMLVACSAWIGNAIPDQQDLALGSILNLTHHSYDNEPAVIWISCKPPNDFTSIGIIEPTIEDKAIKCRGLSGWEFCQYQVLAQWRWDNDREAVLAEDKIKAEELQRAQRAFKQYKPNFTLKKLSDHQFFERWKEYPPQKAIDASRQIMADTVQKLLNMGKSVPESERMAVIQQSVEQFNAIDDFIETIEREDIWEEYQNIIHACGLGAHEDLIDKWREW